MFHFIDFNSTNATLAQDRGKLFERLVRDLVNAYGYTDIELRAKISSMEYDITARGKLDNIPLVGEAKARVKKIDSTTISSFVGKVLPHWRKEPRTLGLFISTSDFTPEAKDYIRSISDPNYNLKTIIGQDILDRLAQERNYFTAKQIEIKATSDFDVRPGGTLFVVTNRGDFFIQLLIRKDETRPRAFCVYHIDGSGITEPDFGKKLRDQVPELEELLFWPPEIKGKSFLDFAQSRIAPLKGTGWFDYKFPAPPDRFIGRDDKKGIFKSFVDRFRTKKSKVMVFQVLSRSGVGKSSFLLKLQDDIAEDGVISIIADARNFRSTLDFLDLIQEFVEAINKAHIAKVSIPDNFESGILSIQEISEQLQKKNKLGLFFIDQFESLFAKPDLYTAFMDLLQDITHLCGNILFCIARKNDQPTTYDDRAKIDLEYLREISETVTLEDFSRDEAISLINHVQDEIEQPLLDRLKEMALEFSQGFPWLQKRICAHIISMIKSGASQDELVQAGLKPEELFREELADLDETEIDFLRRLVQYLPATITDLSEVFRDGDILSKRIENLQAHRLIRLTGRTYDTYNDVLKEYLKTGKTPFGIKYVFRVGPIATLNLLYRIKTHNWKTLSDVREKERRSKGGILNRLRELRLLGLIEYSKGNIKLLEVTVNAYQDDTIWQLIQDRVRQNGLVKDVLDRLAVAEQITFIELKRLMQTSMPLLEVSKDTLDTYVKTLSSWLDKTKLASLSSKGLVLRRERGIISQEELTKQIRDRGVLPSEFFLPSVYMNELIKTLELIRQISTYTELRKIINTDALSNCRAAGLVTYVSDGETVLTHSGKRFLANNAEAKEILKDFLLSKSNIIGYLEKVGHNPSLHLKVLKDTLANFSTGWTESTWEWRSKVLVNWLEYAELVKRKKGMITSYPERLF